MAGNLTAENCGYWFRNPAAQASSNYGIGTDGGVCLYVDEANRSWCTSSGWVDNRAVTIEVANNGGAPNWTISDKAYAKLLYLVEDIARRNGIKEVTYTGDSNGTLIKHQWYAYKSCPGPYLGSKFPEIARIVTARLKGNPTVETSSSANAGIVKKNDLYKVTVDCLEIYHNAWSTSPIVGRITDRGTYTIVEQWGNWGKLKSGAGWIYLGSAKPVGKAESPKPQPTPTKKTNDQIAEEVWAGKWGNEPERSQKLKAAGYDPTSIQKIVNQTKSTTTHISKSGTWKFNTAVKIRSTPSTSSGDTGLIYTSGMTVNIASTQVADGYIWGKYTSTSGQTRYVALQKVNGIAYGKWV